METHVIDAPVDQAPPSGWGYQSLPIRQIRRDGGTQARVGLNEDTIQEYAELMRERRWDFQSRQRPIVLYDGEAFWLADGFHRIEAAQRATLSDFPVEVLRGTQRDAILRAAGANSQHGLRRTNADKRRAVELLLRDEEWRQWSDRKIADVCAISDKTVAAIRRDLSAEIPQIQTRTVERNGTSYQMTPAASKPAPAAETRVALVAAHQAELADMQRRFAVFDWKLTPHGLWYKLSKPDGSLYETVSDMARFVTLLSEMERSRANRIARGDPVYSEPAPALADIFLRLDAHGYAKSGTRTKGMTTFYSFRDYSGRSDVTGGEIELAEGELGYWLAELDTSARYAQQRQEVYLDARDRFDALGWRLERDGAQFALHQPGGKHHDTTRQIEPMIKTLEGLEREIAKSAAAPAPTLAELDALGMPVALHNAGYFWRSAAPPTIEGMDGWTGNAPTVEGAIQLARVRMDAKTEPVPVFPALNQMECKALIREAKVFIERGLDRQYPTIGQALRIAARMALEATE